MEKRKKKRKIETKGEGKNKNTEERNSNENKQTFSRKNREIVSLTSPFLFRGSLFFNPLCSPIFENSLTSSSSLNVKKKRKKKRHAPRSRRIARLFHHLGREKKRLLKDSSSKLHLTIVPASRLGTRRTPPQFLVSILPKSIPFEIFRKTSKFRNFDIYLFIYLYPSNPRLENREEEDQREKKEKKSSQETINNVRYNNFVRKTPRVLGERARGSIIDRSYYNNFYVTGRFFLGLSSM